MEKENKILGLCIAQRWEESERGWGVRPDGYSLHRTEEDLKAFIKAHWDSLPDDPPDCYSRPSGAFFTIQLTEEISNDIGTKKGCWVTKV